jgi:hypothetical protein
MKIVNRVLLALLVALATLSLVNCNSYSCGGFGSLPCTAASTGNGSGNFGGGGGGGGSSTSAFAFVQNGTASPGEVVGYTLNPSDTSLPIALTNAYVPPETPGFDAGMGMAVAQKQFLYVAFGSTDQVYGWTISSSGLLTAATNSPFSVAVSNIAATEFDTNRLATNPAGTLLFIADGLLDKIFVFQIGSGGALTAVTGSPFSVPFSPGNITTDGLGNYLYITATASNHTGSEVGAYSIGSGSNLGVLTAVTGSPFTFPMWQVAGEPTGQFLIGTSGQSLSLNGADDKSLYVFSITQSGTSAGAITPVSGSPFLTAYSPMGIAVQSNSGGNLIYSFGLNDLGTAFNPSEGYALSSTGTLTAVNGSPFDSGEVGDAAQFDQSGTLLFAYGGLFDGTSTVYNVTGFGISDDAAALIGGTLTYGGFWAATDVP